MNLFRPAVRNLHPYVPGEQPQEGGWIKLNTNENPYPPSPRVLEAIDRAARDNLRRYPDPLGTAFRRTAADVLGVEPDWILPANGSDENLTLLMRAFVDPGEVVGSPYPSYILYETLAEIQGAGYERILLNSDWSWDLQRDRAAIDRCKLLFVPNPNSPSGNRWSDETLMRLVPPQGLLVLDEAYGDFVDDPDRLEMLRSDAGERMVVTRSLSKAYSLAGLRFGFAVARPELIEGMRKVKDSYNCDALSLAAAEAAVSDQEWLADNQAKIRATRIRLSSRLVELGFAVVDSQSNFVWATHQRDHAALFAELKQRKILVRYMVFPHVPAEEGGPRSGLRITVGTDDQIDALLAAFNEIL